MRDPFMGAIVVIVVAFGAWLGLAYANTDAWVQVTMWIIFLSPLAAVILGLLILRAIWRRTTGPK